MSDDTSQRKPPRRERSSLPVKLLLFTFLAIGAAGGLGYYSWNLRAEAMTLQGDLKAARVEAAQAARCAEARTGLEDKLTDCEAKRDALGAQQKEFEGDLSATRAELEKLRQQRAQTAKRLAAFRELTTKFQKMIDSGKLDVVVRGGRMIVKLPAGVLFGSGSADLSRDGELALMEVAIVLRQFSDRRFMVEGHTDNRPLEAAATSRFKNNWELSTGRAVTVTQFLIEAKMDPKNLVAAGHGQHDPVGDNSTAKGRQENRRIEIILQANIEELPDAPPSTEPTPE